MHYCKTDFYFGNVFYFIGSGELREARIKRINELTADAHLYSNASITSSNKSSSTASSASIASSKVTSKAVVAEEGGATVGSSADKSSAPQPSSPAILHLAKHFGIIDSVQSGW